MNEFKDKYKAEAKKNKELNDTVENLTLQNDELKGINTSL